MKTRGGGSLNLTFEAYVRSRSVFVDMEIGQDDKVGHGGRNGICDFQFAPRLQVNNLRT
jgi:hypothetical protein